MKTPFEWVEIFNDRVELNTDEHNSLVSLFAQAVNEAVEAEREACAKVADETKNDAAVFARHDNDDFEFHEHAFNVASTIAHRIRARSAK